MFDITPLLERDFDSAVLAIGGRKMPLPILGDGVDNDDPYRALPLERWRDRYISDRRLGWAF